MVVARMSAREKMDILVYEGNLDVEELLDWIRALDTRILTMKISRKTRISNMFSQELKDMQHCGGMSYKMTDATKASKKSRVGIG
jgi:hypothetical protein